MPKDSHQFSLSPPKVRPHREDGSRELTQCPCSQAVANANGAQPNLGARVHLRSK
eukprot:CAMPEP_0174294400 /NCGR_PEP_ID=MMETSP0809-20121228/41544_1 /TAXON_ID=73025 ORGANISM="Eutreptiella gymnastica-like, Strain CCMP1594" /NCGR_SAMPLE_ID=MMETSP0809 /ASSEMBLY_ACC=CAM_ASM_000658 /LENGTH=54 /DNA_ID=CAMNT_0015395829 /DNA_START=358 /DNA_END=522 /DNA_ORIENTATION=+